MRRKTSTLKTLKQEERSKTEDLIKAVFWVVFLAGVVAILMSY